MSTQTAYRDDVTIDSLSVALVAIIAVLQIGGVIAAVYYSGFPTAADTQVTDMTMGAGMAGVVVLESLALIAIYRYWTRLPALARRGLKITAFAGVVTGITYLFASAGELPTFLGIAGLAAGYTALHKHLAGRDLEWITFNTFVVSIGVVALALFGTAVAPKTLLPFLALLLVWDHVAVNRTGIMARLVEMSSASNLPNYIIIPNQLRIDYNAVTSYIQDTNGSTRPAALGAVIGLGDFVVPGALTVSAWMAGEPIAAGGAFIGTVLAMLLLRDAMQRADGGVPGLPWLATGSMCGYLIITGVLFIGVRV